MGIIRLPEYALTIEDVNSIAQKLKISNYIGCFMIDQLPSLPKAHECGVLNLQPSFRKGSHWVCWYKDNKNRIYFDSFGESPPPEIISYLKTVKEQQESKPVIKQSCVTVQKDNSKECGSLCLFVLYHLSKGNSFEATLNLLQERYSKVPYPLCLQ